MDEMDKVKMKGNELKKEDGKNCAESDDPNPLLFHHPTPHSQQSTATSHCAWRASYSTTLH